MKRTTFNYIWENGINKAIKDVWKDIQKYDSDYHIHNREDKIYETVLAEYNIARENIRNNFFYCGVNKDKLIDIHKICSCITYAMVNVKVFSFEIKKEVPLKLLLANYTVAFLSGLYCLYLFIVSDSLRKDSKIKFEDTNKIKTFSFPTTNPGHDSYIQGRIKTLALNDCEGIDFDLLTYADMFFWIETYIKSNIIKKN